MNEQMIRIPMAQPEILQQDIDLVLDALSSGRLSLGPYLERFETEFARYVGARYAIGVSSGTAGLHSVLCAKDIGPGDEVITTSFSFVASSNCILYQGATPKFVDINEESFNIDPVRIAEAVTDRTRAILPVHVFGQPCAMDEIGALAKRHGLFVVEDACEALGSEYRGRLVGTFGDASVFAFYANKQMTTGEGGIVVTDNPDVAQKIRSLRNQGRDEMGTWLRHVRLGFNYRLGELNAALGLSQLSRIEQILERRDRVSKFYEERLRRLDSVRLLSPAATTTRLSWFVLVVRLDPTIPRVAVIEQLDKSGVPSRAYFAPIHLQPFYRERFEFREGDFPVTERVASSMLALPFYTNMEESQVEYVVNCLDQAIQRAAA